MDFIGLSMEVLLAVLLIAALAYGVRLEKKLKALRDSQAGFAEAVLALDAAAARAQAGLNALRGAADEAHDELHDRILKARELKTELERLIARADRSPLAPQPAAPPAAAVPSGALTAPVLSRTLEGLRNLAERAQAPAPAPRPAHTPARRPAAHNLDDDLFEASGDHR